MGYREDNGRRTGLANRRHGHSSRAGSSRNESLSYRSWRRMLYRARYPETQHGDSYLGVRVCSRWLAFENFLADMGERPSIAHTVDRFPDLLGNYEPGNCRWATKKEQAVNRRTTVWFEVGGERMCCLDASKVLGVSRRTLMRRRLSEMQNDPSIRQEASAGRRR